MSRGAWPDRCSTDPRRRGCRPDASSTWAHVAPTAVSPTCPPTVPPRRACAPSGSRSRCHSAGTASRSPPSRPGSSPPTWRPRPSTARRRPGASAVSVRTRGRARRGRTRDRVPGRPRLGVDVRCRPRPQRGVVPAVTRSARRRRPRDLR